MKNLNSYIIQNIFENNNEIIVEGFWKKLGSIFGFSSEKLSKTMKNWSNDLKTGFTTGQYIAAKSNNNDIKKIFKNEIKSAEIGTKELFNTVKQEVEKIIKGWDSSKYNDADIYSQYNLINLLSNELKDNDGKEISNKLKSLIDKKNSNAEQEYNKEQQKVEKAGVDDGPSQEENTSDQNTDNTDNNESTKEATKETTDVITDNKTLFQELAKVANINGEGLRDYVAKNILTRNENGQMKTKEEIAKISEDEILATCIIVAGAQLTKNEETFNRIAKALGNSKNGLRKSMEIVQK